MSNSFENIEFVFPKEADFNSFVQTSDEEEPFSERAISFLNALALILKQDPRSGNFPELLTFAFFCRKANLIELKKTYYPRQNTRKGSGLAFHISPSNMPLTFAYSLLSGILSGNRNVVRLPSKRFEQVEIFCDALETLSLLTQYDEFARRILLVRYDKLNSATSFFSSVCDVRIIWGGNLAVNEIRKNELREGAIDIAFADKYSICVINADSYILEAEPEKISRSFYNDSFLFDQNACTSPHLVAWLGSNENIADSQNIFWDTLHKLVKKKYNFQSHSAIDKLLTFCEQAIHFGEIKKITTPDNLIWRVELSQIPKNIDKFRSNCGYFVEYKTNSLFDLSGLISAKHQTIASYGIDPEHWRLFGLHEKINVMERIRPIGKTSDFSLTWDGCNLIDSLSKEIE